MKICPSCHQEFSDEEEECPEHGAILVGQGVKNNPRLPGVRKVKAEAPTAMFSLEQLQEEEERLMHAVDNPTDELAEDFDGNDDETQGLLAKPADRDATRAITVDDIERMRSERDARKAGAEMADGDTQRDPAPDKTHKTKVDKTALKKRPPTAEDEARRNKKLIVIFASAFVLVLAGGGLGVYLAFLRKVPVEVVTTPPGAIVLIDNVEIGSSPLSWQVKRGAHSVRARLPGYLEAAEVIEVSEARSFVLNLKKDDATPRDEETAGDAETEDPIRAKADALYEEARTLLEKGRLDDAEARFQALAALVPDDKRAIEGLTEIGKRRKAGKKQGGGGAGGPEGNRGEDVAIAGMKPAQRRKEAVMHLDQARTAYDLGELEKAKEHLSKCLRFNPSHVQCHRIMARVYTKQDNVPKVKYHLQRYLELGGSDDDYKVRDWLRTH